MKKRTRIILAIATLIIYIISSGSDGLYIYADEPVSSESAATTSTNPEITGISYDPSDDSLVISCSAVTKGVWIANLKKESGAALTKKKFIYLPVTVPKSKVGQKSYAYIALNNREEAANLAISEDKTAYLYITAEEPSSEKKVYTPNYVVEASPYKKFDIFLDYASMDRDGESCAISSVKITKSDKSTAEYSRIGNGKQFDELLCNLKFGFFESVEGDKEYCMDDYAFYKDAYSIGCSSAPTGVKVSVGEDFTTGTFIYTLGENQQTDWTFDYDSSWGDNRVYNYTLECDTDKLSLREIYGPDDSTLVYDVYTKDRILYAVIHGSTEENDSYLYEDTEFVYREVETDDGKKSGFYAEIDGKERDIKEFGLLVEAKIGKELTIGDKVTVKVSEAVSAADFGVAINFTSENVKLNESDTIVLNKEKYYNFNGEYLREIVEDVSGIEKEDKRKLMLAFRLEGSDASNGKNAYRSSKIKTVKVAKPQKEIKIKIDNKKEALIVKNGYDFIVSGKVNDKSYSEGWKTILPFNAEGTAKEAIVDINEYHPVKNVSVNAAGYTGTKISSIPIEDILDGNGVSIMVRKSATVSNPASVAEDGEGLCEMYISARAGAPVVTLKDTGYLSVMDSKDSFILPSISMSETDSAKGKKEFEYAVISKEDFEGAEKLSDILDFSSIKWNKYTKGKKITLGKTKSKYRKTGEETAVDHVLKSGDYILIRRKAYTTKLASYTYPTLASNYLVTYITEETVDSSKKTVWRTLSVNEEDTPSTLDNVTGNSESSSGEPIEGNTLTSGEIVTGNTSVSGEPA